MAQGTRYNEPFFWHRIVNVGWGGRVAIVTIVSIYPYGVVSVDPADGLVEPFPGAAGTLLGREDYQAKQILSLPVAGEAGSIIAENEITGVLVVDRSITQSGFVTKPDSGGNFPGLDAFNDAVAIGTAEEGRPPEISVIGAIFESDFTDVTHPNGSSVSYLSGFHTITFTPPDFDWTDSAQAIWYHETTIPQVNAEIVRKSWLVNFASRVVDGAAVPFVAVAGVNAVGAELDFETTYQLKIYAAGTGFVLAADGGVTTNMSAILTQTGTATADDTGVIRTFDKNGFVAGDL